MRVLTVSLCKAAIVRLQGCVCVCVFAYACTLACLGPGGFPARGPGDRLGVGGAERFAAVLGGEVCNMFICV